ncbi:hypothetical protein, variant 1 [Aphanomyces astaci]|uniref:F-box domain-containing protein n=2 Tax=Aphanomyces astaci TaxID=112090 RepID=W4GWD9_APHAT|nr:hypothetical protein, variant 1 [Aphanomyces astaci]ETV84040.1 hypothetical protein, variant 1 [Aphanomyces astaci]|eukprot:XP_009825732.1 hypothetical protein, variant 1 [Aphanomyces astaci]
MQHLPTDSFLHVAGFLGVRDLKAISMTCHSFSKLVHHGESTLWKDHFYRRWNRFNFALDLSLPCVMSELLRQQCHTDSASYRFLTHLVQRLPAYADVDHTHTKAGHVPQHRFRVLEHADGFADAPLTIAYDGNVVGGDRCVRSNAPFCTTPHATVLRRRDSHGHEFYRLGVSRNGYFEISIRPCVPPPPMRPTAESSTPTVFHFQQGHHPQNNCVAIGIADRQFNVIRNQPGWRGVSYGYHGDDGHAFHLSFRGWEYGETFGVGDTVGCSFVNNASVVFTRNGQVAGPPIPCAPSSPMYPIVGVDSPDAIEWNFGHKPFAFDGLALEDTPLDDADVLWEEESCDEVQDESSIGEGLEYYTFALDDDDDEWDDEFVYHEDEDDLEYDEPSEYEDDMEPMEE